MIVSPTITPQVAFSLTIFHLFADYNSPNRREKHKIDVHGLTVREALKAADEALRDIQADGGTHLTVVTGKGKHSESGKPSIRPAMKEFFEE